jgi:hypothetical protein
MQRRVVSTGKEARKAEAALSLWLMVATTTQGSKLELGACGPCL